MQHCDRIEKPYDTTKPSKNSSKLPSQYRALTINQPFVEAILRGIKRFENRSLLRIVPLSGKPLREREANHKHCRFCPSNDATKCVSRIHYPGLKNHE